MTSGTAEAKSRVCFPPPTQVTQHSRTFKRRKPSIENELEIAKLPIRQDNSWKFFRFRRQLLPPRSVASDEVLENAALLTVRLRFFEDLGLGKRTVWWVGHCKSLANENKREKRFVLCNCSGEAFQTTKADRSNPARCSRLQLKQKKKEVGCPSCPPRKTMIAGST